MNWEEYEAEFDRVWPMLERAILQYGDTHSKEDVWDQIRTQNAELWTTKNSATVTEMVLFPSGMLEMRCWLSGGDLEEIKTIEPSIVEWAKKSGCHRVTITGRRGWLKTLDGYREKAVLMVKEL